MRHLSIMGVAAALALTAGSGAAQSALDRPPDLNEGWVVAPGSLQFDFLHRFTVSPAPDHKVTNSPTFLLGAGLPGRFLVGFNYATNSDVAQRYPNEWEFLGRWQPLSSDFGPLDATLEGAYNLAARSVDGALAVGRAIGRLRLQAEGRVFSHAYDTTRTRVALAGGGTLRLGQWVALAGDVGKLLGSGSGDTKVVWGGGLQLAIPYTPHTISLQATNANTGTLEGASRASDRVRYGFEFTIPLNMGRFLGRTGTPVAKADTTPRPALPVSAAATAEAGRPAPADTSGAGAGAAAGGAGADSSVRAPALPAAPAAVAPAPAAARGTVAAPAHAAPAHRAAATRAVIRNLAFLPGKVEVPVGGTVTWTNHDGVVHSITADDGSFDSGNIAPGSTWRHTFTRAGRWTFHCTPHPFMHGTVVVQ